jgi:tetratricopeptide (TPR) repeat protein
MPRLQSFARLLALVLGLSLPLAVKADGIQDINQLFRKGDLNAALAGADRFLAQNPKDAQARFLKGLILADLGKPADAIQVFSALTEDYPELPEPYNNLAVLHAAAGRYDEAKHALDMAIHAHPGYATAYENLGDLYARMAAEAYARALQLDAKNKTAPGKLTLAREILAHPSRRDASPAAPSGDKP